jgi:hypothetical protein
MRPYRAAALPPSVMKSNSMLNFFAKTSVLLCGCLTVRIGLTMPDILHGIHAGFEEGFDTPDLQQAAAMLKAWAATD